MTPAQTPLDWLDRARSGTIALVARTPLLPILARRDARARARAIAAIVVAFAMTVVCPAAALAISPAVFGVPHIAAAVRYLVLRQGLTRGFLVSTLALALAMTTLRVLEQTSGTPAPFARGEVAVAVVWALVAAGFAARSSGHVGRLALAVLGVLLLGAVALVHPLAMRVAFAHAHNLGVVVLWLVGFRRGRFPAGTVAIFVGAIALLLTGATVAATESLGGVTAMGVDLRDVGRWLLPGAAASVAVPLVLAHVFTDSVHYAFWLGVIPDETLAHQGSLSFRMTMRGLVRDFGKAGLAVVAALAVAVLLGSALDHAGTRNVYFAIAGFHGYVEGVMLVFLLVRGGRRRATFSALTASPPPPSRAPAG